MSAFSQVKSKKVRAAKAKRTMYAPLQQGPLPTRSTTPMAFRDPPPAVYALTAWSVKKANGKWLIAPTGRFDDKPAWSKPYATLQRATTAIARKLADEVIKRHDRRREHYGIND